MPSTSNALKRLSRTLMLTAFALECHFTGTHVYPVALHNAMAKAMAMAMAMRFFLFLFLLKMAKRNANGQCNARHAFDFGIQNEIQTNQQTTLSTLTLTFTLTFTLTCPLAEHLFICHTWNEYECIDG